MTKIKTRAIQKGVWFRMLNRVERVRIELTIRIVKRVRSLLLTKTPEMYKVRARETFNKDNDAEV